MKLMTETQYIRQIDRLRSGLGQLDSRFPRTQQKARERVTDATQRIITDSNTLRAEVAGLRKANAALAAEVKAYATNRKKA